MKNNWDLYDLSSELTAASAILTALSLQLDNEDADRLTEKHLRDAIFGASCYIDRISEDIIEIDNKYDMHERTVTA